MPLMTSYDIFFNDDAGKIMLLYKQLFPACFTGNMYQNMMQLLYVNGNELTGFKSNSSLLLDYDCALNVCYANGQPTFQFCFVF